MSKNTHARRKLGMFLLLLSWSLIIPIGMYEAGRGTDMPQWLLSVFLQLVLSLVAVGFTLIAIDPPLLKMQEQLDEEKEVQRLKADLLFKLHSRIEGVAAQASEQLEYHKWTRDGSLKGIHLDHANLNQVAFLGANLEGASLEGASLQKADLRSANLHDAILDECDFSGADLSCANLSETMLQAATFENAFLDGADLSGAYLEGANLKNAKWQGVKLGWGVSSDDYRILPAAKFDETTCLPDGTLWTPDTDMRRFTDPTHPQFWDNYKKPSQEIL